MRERERERMILVPRVGRKVYIDVDGFFTIEIQEKQHR